MTTPINRLLFISSRPLYPITGGDQVRTVQQLDFLTSRFNVDVLYITNLEDKINIKDYNKNINSDFPFKISKLQHIVQTLRFLFNQLPLQVNYFYNSDVQRFINEHISDYQAVFCNNIRTAEYVRKLKGPIKYLDFVDAISMNYEKARKKGSLFKRLIYEIDYRRCRKYEKECLRTFDACAVISEVDNNYIMQASL